MRNFRKRAKNKKFGNRGEALARAGLDARKEGRRLRKERCISAIFFSTCKLLLRSNSKAFWIEQNRFDPKSDLINYFPFNKINANGMNATTISN